MSPEVSGFFDAHRDLLPLYARLEEAISARHPDTRITVHKTQISFYGLRQFACVSFLRPGRAKDFPGSFLTLSLGLPCPPELPRAVSVPVRPGRYTVHISLYGPEDLTDALLDLTDEAWAFAHRPAK